ncbi:hypothetical protein Rleg5DRAFT_6974 [Rhizobium leguminosarum bv. viciae WSM1455]|nr:hypothetical protein Rleg5DRAFT_6974 [Rhizobium leguminosarum bv. viciae WSM1455]
MKRNRFTDEQIIGILKEHEAGTPVSELWTAGQRSRRVFQPFVTITGMNQSPLLAQATPSNLAVSSIYRQWHPVIP